ncbi:MAG: bacterial Ig-like domain-containing protein [Acutalibacteraceae bacterium]
MKKIRRFGLKRVLPLLLCVILTGCLSLSVAAEGESEEYGSDEPMPILVSNKEELSAIRNDLYGWYRLTDDIVFTEADFAEGGAFYNGGAGWEPIGTEEEPFCGELDGEGHTIRGLQLTCSEKKGGYLGLFGWNMGIICEVQLEDCAFSTAYGGLGGIAGYNSGMVTGCQVSGSLESTAAVGGLVGTNDGLIYQCVGSATVNSRNAEAGGIAGENVYGIICYSVHNGSVTAGWMAGGIAGQNGELAGIGGCYNTGSVTSTRKNIWGSVGGIAGYNLGQIIECYQVGDMLTGGYAIGGIVGASDQESQIVYAYYPDCFEKGVGDADNGGTDGSVRCTDAQMQEEQTFEGFDFFGVWGFDKESGYPYPQLLCPEMTSVELITPQEGPLYTVVGDYPDLTGIKLKVTRIDGAVQEFDITQDVLDEYMFSPYWPGEQVIYFSYREYICEEPLIIEVFFDEQTTMSILTYPQKTQFRKGEPLNVSDGELLITYADGTTDVFYMSEDMVSGFDNRVSGEQDLTLTLGGKSVLLSVEVLDEVFGDVTGDEILDMRDVLMLYRAASGELTLTEEQIACADMYEDGDIDVIDALCVYDIVSGTWG